MFGRLFSYNEQTDQLTLLMDGLYFPNGLQLTPDKTALLINENTQARITKFYIKRADKGKWENQFVLPGYSDSIRLTPNGTLLVPFGASRYPIYGSLLDMFGRLPWIRDLMAWVRRLTRYFASFEHSARI
jgi:hypothetical protein